MDENWKVHLDLKKGGGEIQEDGVYKSCWKCKISLCSLKIEFQEAGLWA